ncbi:MAG: protein kinase [Myxococcota bacterium]
MTAPIRLGPLLLSHPIGRGGMGSVWRAQHPEGVPVAVKLLREKFADDERLLDVFRFEVRSVASLDHPAIVRVYDYGVVSAQAAEASEGRLVAGAPWLAMEFAGAGTFADRPPVTSWEELSGIVLHLLDGLAHSHAREIVHRDLKPQNVLVRDDGTPALTDFGIAYALTRNSPSSAAAGTPGYMAPEQVLGRVHDMGPWTDLYALGCLSYGLLAGRPPFVGKSREAVLRRQLSDPIPPIAATFDLPLGGAAWIERMLDRKPTRRFRCAADAAHAFSTLDTHPVLPPPIPAEWRPAHGPTTERPKGMGLAVFLLRPWPLVGRALLQDQLWQALGEVSAARTPRAVVIEGEAGVGTTRLARWLAERAHETGAAEVLWVRHRGRDVGLPAAAVNHLQLQGLDLDDAAQRLRSWLKRLGDEDPDRRSFEFAELLQPQDGQSKRTPEDWLGLIMAISDERPLLFVIDDLHRAGESLDLANALLDTDLPVLVVATLNPDQRSSTRSAAVDALRARSIILQVPTLPDGLQRELVDKGTGLAPRLAKELVARTHGNPLYAVHAVIDWARQGLLMPTSTGFDLRQASSPTVPKSIRQSIEARLLPLIDDHPTAPEALEVLAIMGGERIRESDWSAATSEAGQPLAEDARTAMLSAGLTKRSARPGRPPRWTLAHPLLRGALVQRAVEANRFDHHHRSAARALVKKDRSSAQDRGIRHFIEANEFDEALDTLVGLLRVAPADRKSVLLGAAESIMDKLRYRDDHIRRVQFRSFAESAHPPTVTRRRAPDDVARLPTQLIEVGHSPPTPSPRSVRAPQSNTSPGTTLAEPVVQIVQVEYDEDSDVVEPVLEGIVEFEPTAATELPESFDLLGTTGEDLGPGDLETLPTTSDVGTDGRTEDDPAWTTADEEARTWFEKGEDLLRRGQPREASPWLTRAQKVFREGGDHVLAARIEAYLGAVARGEGDMVLAMERARRARDELRALGADAALGELEVSLTQLTRGETSQARFTLERLVTDENPRIAWIASGALLFCVAGDRSAWRQWLNRTTELQHENPAMEVDAAWPIEWAARRAAESGSRERAREGYTLAEQRYLRLGDEEGRKRIRKQLALLD